MNAQQQAAATAAVEMALVERDDEAPAVTIVQPREGASVTQLQPRAPTAAQAFADKAKNEIDRGTDETIRELQSMSREIDALCLAAEDHRQRLHAWIDEHAALVHATMQAKSKMVPMVKHLGDQFAAAGRKE